MPRRGRRGARGVAGRGGGGAFPGDHGGFASSDWSPSNDPAVFAATLREVIDGE